jgi:hypothetical protein
MEYESFLNQNYFRYVVYISLEFYSFSKITTATKAQRLKKITFSHHSNNSSFY